ncbi:MAG: polysaccharide biosynthesis tyrosine autokinase [Methylacidiphilales bacterium]|nr:polysaccharide biosynthesis tyrosine autokinase [Candidatus Methylacidiphilales bacterium]
MIFTIFALTMVSGVYVTNEVLPKIYTATAQVRINATHVLDVQGLGQIGSPDKIIDPITFSTEYEIMKSPEVLEPIIKNLQLDKVWAKRVFKTNLDSIPMQDALAYMDKILKLDYTHGTSIIDITASSEVPKECADIANAVAIGYKHKRDDEENLKSNRGTDSLRDQITQQQDAVDQKTKEVEKMRQDIGAKGIEIQDNGVVSSINDRVEADLEERQRDLLQAQEEYDTRKVLLDRSIKLPDDQFIDTLNGMGRPAPDIDSLRQDAFKTESSIQDLMKKGYAENHPEVQSLQAELDSENQQISDQIAGLRRALSVETDMAKSKVDLLQAQVNDLTNKVREDTTSAIVPFRHAQRELEDQQSILDALKVRLQSDIADSSVQESPVDIISSAEPPEPEHPASPKKGLLYAVSAMAGLFAGLGVAFLIEYLDTSVKTMADAETLLGLPVLTVIPNKGGPMPLSQDPGQLPQAEGYRILRAKLDLKVQNGIGPSLTMLSGGPGEGKSTTIYNLAIVCAQVGQTVILIDCDLRRPTLHELVGVSNERGLSNYLRGEGEAINFIQRTAIPKLQILTAGNMPMSEIGILAGDKIRSMLDDLKQRYDLVLIDAPPVLGISDASIIAREVDYVILVIQHRRYPREISLRAKLAIEEVHGNCVGMVLNCVSVKSDDSYYYYSSYGNYYRKRTDRPKKRKDIAQTNGKPGAPTSRKVPLESDEF